MDCPKAADHARFAHLDLGDGEWAHLRRKLQHAEAQRIEVAMLAANYETADSSRLTKALIRSVLMGAPEKWRIGYTEEDGTVVEGQFEPTMTLIERFLDQYETDHEMALLSPKARTAMAEATYHLMDTYGAVFLVESTVGDWPLSDGQQARIVERKAQTLWNRWNKEMDDRLKAAGADSD